MRKVFLAGIAALSLVVLLAGCSIYQPSINQDVDTKPDWRTYTNSSKGYSISYPSDLIVDDSNLEQVTIGSLAVPYVDIKVYKLEPNTDLQSFVQKKLINEFNGLLTKEEISWVIIDNDPSKIGVKFPIKAGGYNGELYWVYVGHNNLVYKVAAQRGYNDMTQSEFESKLMSDFKFID